MRNTYKYGIHEGVGGVFAHCVPGYALVVAHVLPLDVRDQEIAAGQDPVAMSLDDLLVLVVQPGDLGPGTSVHLAGQLDVGAHQIEMSLLGVDDAWLLGTRVGLLRREARGSWRMHHSAGVDRLGASASHTRVGARLAQHVIDDVRGSDAHNGTGRLLGHLVGVQVVELRTGQVTHHPLDAGHLGAHHLANDLDGGTIRLLQLRRRRLGELEPVGVEGSVPGLVLRLDGVVHIVAIVYQVHGSSADSGDTAEQQQR